jgi:FlaA1/EpsC-like NDP-sugar epimerase
MDIRSGRPLSFDIITLAGEGETVTSMKKTIWWWRRHLGGGLVDTGIMALSFAAAFALRFDFQEPLWGWRGAWQSFATVWAVQTAVMLAFDCNRRWRPRARDLPRFAGAMVTSGGVLTVLRILLPDMAYLSSRPPYSITLINGVLLTVGLLGARWLWSLYTVARSREARLLHRREKPPVDDRTRAYYKGACVLVTGAGGSIGSELVRQVVLLGASRVVMVERGENALYEIARRMPSDVCVPEMADVNNLARMREILTRHRPSVILHAAAYKHVPMVELNPQEGLRNNTLATRRFGELAREAGVGKFVMISTDKAVNPVSVMGLSKRLAEWLLLDLNGGGTVFSAVRFGNVLGSSGSVVPLWEEQIANGGPVTVTDPKMKRYFMTVSEAVGLVLTAAVLPDDDGCVYTLDMGEPVLIAELAREMIRQAGFKPDLDIPIAYTGIRPGEKLFEELDVTGRAYRRTGHAKIYVTLCRRMPAEKLLTAVDRVLQASEAEASSAVRALFEFCQAENE